MIMRQRAAASATGSLLGRTVQQLWPGSLQALPRSCFTAVHDKIGSSQSARPRPLVTASALRNNPPHPEIPGSDLPPSSGTPQPTSLKSLSEQPQPQGSATKQRPAKHAADSSGAPQVDPQQQATKQSKMSQVFVPDEPNMPESSIRPAPQQGAALDKPQASLDGAPAQHQLPGVPGDWLPPEASPQGNSPEITLLPQAANSASHGHWAGRVPVPDPQQESSGTSGDLVLPGVPPQGAPQGNSQGDPLLPRAADSAAQGYWAGRVPVPPPENQMPGVPGDLIPPGVPPQGTPQSQAEPAQQASSEEFAGQGYWAGRVPAPPPPTQNQMPGLPGELVPPGVPPQGTPKKTLEGGPSLPQTADSAGQGYWAGRVPVPPLQHQLPGVPGDLVPPGAPPQGTPQSTRQADPSLPQTETSSGQGYWAGRIPAAPVSHHSK